MRLSVHYFTDPPAPTRYFSSRRVRRVGFLKPSSPWLRGVWVS